MHHNNTPIAVWHSQPFEVPVLDSDMRWALVRYRNPQEQPRKFSLLKNLFLIRRGQPFVAVGNEKCTSIRVWQFRWWVSWPKSKRIELAVRQLAERNTDVNFSTTVPLITANKTAEIERCVLRKEMTPKIELQLHTNPLLYITPINLQPNEPQDAPLLKSFHSHD